MSDCETKDPPGNTPTDHAACCSMHSIQHIGEMTRYMWLRRPAFQNPSQRYALDTEPEFEIRIQ